MNRIRRWIWPLRRTPLHPQWLLFRQESETRRAITRGAHGSVLDVGCGDRWASSVLPDGCTYVGLDYPTTVGMGYPGRPEIFGDAGMMPFKADCFDTVLMMDVLEHLQAPNQAVSEAFRILRPGGRLILQVPFLYPLHDEPHDFQRWTRHGLIRLCANNNLIAENTIATGQPSQTAAALFAIAMAKSGLDALTKKNLSLLLVPLFAFAIPLVNLSGWLLGKLLPDSDMMPMSYRLTAIKPV